MSDFFIKIKLFFLNAFNKVLVFLDKISSFFRFIFIDIFYSKVLFNIFVLPLYKIYKKLVRDIVTQNNLQLNLLGRMFAVLFNKKIVGFFIILLIFSWVIVDNIKIYSIYDKELKLNNSIFFALAGDKSNINSVIVDNTVIGKKNNSKNGSYLSQGDVNSEISSEFIPVDPEDITYFAFNNGSVVKPQIMDFSGYSTGGTDVIIDNNEDSRFASKVIYVVKSGDTTAGIAKSFGISKDTVLYENKMKDTDVLKIGQKLSILPFTGLSHKVEYGDTLLDLSIKYKISLDKIRQYNFIRGDILRLGQALIIPTTSIPKYSNVAVRPTTTTKVTTTTSILYPKINQVEGDSSLKAHKFPYGQCTWYVATRRFVPWAGHAKSWLLNAQKFGYEIGKKPAVGAIVATKENALYGHVAYVEEVKDDVIVISEMNYKGWGIVNKREIPINDWRILGYIY